MTGHDLWILSAAPEWQPEAKDQKKRWIRKHFPKINPKQVIVTTRADKKNYAPGGQILIDDYGRNIREWDGAGGQGIKHTSATDTLKKLENLQR